MRSSTFSIATVFLLGLFCEQLVSARTPADGGSQLHGFTGSGCKQTAEVDVGKIAGMETDTCDFADSRKKTGPQGPREEASLTAPRIYRVLARRPVGRYILATASLIGECTRVYAPAPLGLVASSLCNRAFTVLVSQRRNGRAPAGEKRPQSGLSYDQFLSHDTTMEDQEPPGGTLAAVPPEKYGRVSSSFLTRHAIGHVGPTQEGLSHGVIVPQPIAALDSVCDQRLSKHAAVRPPRRFPETKTGSVFKSLIGLGRGAPQGTGDDLDLLSGSSEEDVAEVLSLGGSGGDVPEVISSEAESSRVPFGGNGRRVVAGSRSRVDDVSARNLVSSVDDNATALVKRLRKAAQRRNTEGAKTLKGGELGTRRARRSQGSEEEKKS